MASGKQGSHAKAPVATAIVGKKNGGGVVGGGMVVQGKPGKTYGANKKTF
jgi:hypothetical protein